MRPTTHRGQLPAHGCFDCTHSRLLQYKQDLLCFHGDRIVTTPGILRDEVGVVLFDGQKSVQVELADGDEYDRVWGGRIVDEYDICEEYKQT